MGYEQNLLRDLYTLEPITTANESEILPTNCLKKGLIFLS